MVCCCHNVLTLGVPSKVGAATMRGLFVPDQFMVPSASNDHPDFTQYKKTKITLLDLYWDIEISRNP